MFTETLHLAVTLTKADKLHKVAGGRIMACAVELGVHGFSGSVTFHNDYAVADTLIDWFAAPELMEIELRVAPTVETRLASALRLRGLVCGRELVESSANLEGKPVLVREYTVHFVDAAALLWRQHQPLLLLSESDDGPATMGDLIRAQRANGIDVDITLADASAARPLLCLPTGEGQASFYDFLLWYVDRAGGCWWHDYYSNGAYVYHLAPKRQTRAGDGPGAMLEGHEIARQSVSLPAPPRHAARLLNAYSDAADTTVPVAQPYAVSGIARDRLLRTATGADVDAHKQLEQDRMVPAYPELQLSLTRFPAVGIMPGARIALDPAQHARERFGHGKTFRVVSLSFTAKAQQSAAHAGDGQARQYEAALELICESEDDRRARLPPHVAPVWPILVEGKVVADIGEADDRVYLPSDDQKRGLSAYVVHVPLWNCQVRVPFQPQFVPGHFFAPAYKGSRVLLALYFDRAEIVQFLDWGPDVQLPTASGGNHLLFGKNGTSQTSLKHVYVDGKPVFSVSRVADADRGRLQLEDGNMVLEVKEEQSASQATAKHSVAPQQELAKSQLQADSQKSLSKINTAADEHGRKLGEQLSGVRGRLSGSLESLRGETGAKTESGRAALQGNLDAVDAKLAELQARVAAANAELNDKEA